MAGCRQSGHRSICRETERWTPSPSPPCFGIVHILQHRQRRPDLSGVKVLQRVGQRMLGRPPHPAEDIGCFGGASARSDQPVAAVPCRTEDEGVPIQRPERLPDVANPDIRNVAADDHHRSWRQTERRASHRTSHPLAKVAAALGANPQSWGWHGQVAPIRRHRDPDGPSRVLAEPVQQGAKRHAREMQGSNGADPTREPPFAPAQAEFAREDDDMAPDRHDLTRTDAV